MEKSNQGIQGIRALACFDEALLLGEKLFRAACRPIYRFT